MGCCDTPEPLNTTIPRCAGPPGRRSLNTRGIALSRAFRAATAHRPRITRASPTHHPRIGPNAPDAWGRRCGDARARGHRCPGITAGLVGCRRARPFCGARPWHPQAGGRRHRPQAARCIADVAGGPQATRLTMRMPELGGGFAGARVSFRTTQAYDAPHDPSKEAGKAGRGITCKQRGIGKAPAWLLRSRSARRL